MTAPSASRPYMPGYGVLPADQGTGLLPWSWVERRVTESRNYWLATVDAAGTAHLMPVWAVWMDGALWFSCSNGSRKARNLASNPRCSLSTENPLQPVVVHGEARRITDREHLASMLGAENAKYGMDYGSEMIDPAANSVFALTPDWVFALDTSDFSGSPTRFVLNS
jgi:hypothetical protein